MDLYPVINPWTKNKDWTGFAVISYKTANSYHSGIFCLITLCIPQVFLLLAYRIGDLVDDNFFDFSIKVLEKITELSTFVTCQD